MCIFDPYEWNLIDNAQFLDFQDIDTMPLFGIESCLC